MTLTELANRLNSRHPLADKLPAVLLLTDEVRLPDPLPAAAALPPGAGVILRHYGDPERKSLAQELSKLCRGRRLHLLIGGDGPLAMDVAADGVHLPEFRATEAVRWRRQCPNWIVTAAVHSQPALVTAVRAGAHAALVGPVFATASHPGARPLGPVRFAALSRAAGQSIAVYALGGLTMRTAPRIMQSGAVGIAAISGLS